MRSKVIVLAALLCATALGNPQTNAPSIAIQRAGSQLRLVFTGTLQTTSSLSGPWSDLTGAASPYLESTTPAPKFYRARTAGVQSIFSSSSVVELIITGPLQEHFDLAFAGQPDGIFPPIREKPYFDGRLAMEGFDLPVSLRVRGNSSLQECPFPKLKFKVSKQARPGTPFFDAREIKIGTHCAEGGRGTIGRLRHETAAFREALAYEAMHVLGFTAPRVRRAYIEYRDTSSTNRSSPAGWELARMGFIIDSAEVVAERLGGRALDDEEVDALIGANFSEELITSLRLFHVLLGNWDYALSLDGRELWNTDVIELPNKTLLPVPGDFDLASWVTEEVQLSAPWDYHPELEDIDRQARFEVERIQASVSPASFEVAKDRFMQNRAALEAKIESALIDDAGRTNVLRHLTALFRAFEPLPKPPSR